MTIREIAEKYQSTGQFWIKACHFEAALRECREAALEEAAMVVNRVGSELGGMTLYAMNGVAEQIRALKEQPAETPKTRCPHRRTRTSLLMNAVYCRDCGIDVTL